jgi:hypothetical protein
MKYEEQFERMMRWYRRFGDTEQGRPHTVESLYYDDEVQAFFISCYHLKDWILNDDGSDLRTSKHELDEFVKQNEPLAICGDLCIGLKHLKRDRSDWSGVDPKLGAKDTFLELGQGPPKVRIKYYIETSTGRKDAFALATDCVKKWKEFIENSRTP